MTARQALASERELLVSLFGNDRPAEPGGRAGSGEMPDTAALLDRVFESICRPLKARAPVQLDMLAVQCCGAPVEAVMPFLIWLAPGFEVGAMESAPLKSSKGVHHLA